MRAIISVTVILVVLASGARSAQFTSLGSLNGGLLNSFASDVSADGRWVTGTAVLGPDHLEAFVWSRHSGAQALGDLPTGLIYSSASGISNDGQTVVGLGSARGDYVYLDGFIWSADDGMAPLSFLDGEEFPYSYGQDISGNGQIAIGTGSSTQGNQAFRWTSDEGIQGLGDLPGGPFESYARAISDDGQVIVGSSKSELALEAFRWTSTGGMQGLGFMTGFEIESHSNAVNSDGSVIIGTSARQGWRWTEPTGMVNLGSLPELGERSILSPNGLSADGGLIVGSARAANRPDDVAIIWDQLHGVRNLQRVLEVEYGLALAGWTLKSASAVSDDGMVIVGNGLNPFGQTEAWIINLSIPEPTTVHLAIAALLSCSMVRRR